MILQVLAQATSPQGGGYGQILFFVGIAVVFLFFYDTATAKKSKKNKRSFWKKLKKETVL